MKRVFLYAYDKQNLGDDLFVHTITKRYPHVHFYMWSDRRNKETFSCLPNLKVIDKDSRLVHGLQRFSPSLVARYKGWLEKRCDAVVYIGGSIFMEYPNWPQICNWWEYEAKNRPFYVLGANFGPWHTEEYREKMEHVFRYCRDICFRDRYSEGLFHNVNTVRQAPDILFSYPMPKVEVKEKQVFVSVINCTDRDESHDLSCCDEQYVSNMANILRGYMEAGYNLVLASFCKEEGDESGIDKILAAMDCKNDPRIHVLCYDGTNAGALTTAIAESEFVIATRFHATILAMAAGRPVLPIIYSDKTKHVLEDLCFTGAAFDLRRDAFWHVSQIHIATAPAVQAQEHFHKLDQILV